MSSSVQVASSIASYQILLSNETALSCAKALEVPVEASAGGPSPQDAKDLPEMELDKSADVADHGSPMRMRAVLRTLFKAAESVGLSTKNPKIECELQGVYGLIDNSGDTEHNDTALRMEDDNCSAHAVTDKIIKIEMDQEKRKEEIIMLRDRRAFQQESGSIELDSQQNSSQTVKESDVQTQEEEFAVETSLQMMNLTTTHTDEGKVSDRTSPTLATDSSTKPLKVSTSFQFTGLNHVAFCCENLEKTLEFYCGLLGLKFNPDRPNLPYRGAWLFLGAEGIHIMEVPNPDPVYGRPHHGGWDRHACLNCTNVESLQKTLDKAGIPYQISIVPSIFCRDPDGNGLEFIEMSLQ